MHVCISGPHAAGKDAVIGELLKQLNAKHPGKFLRVRFLTTRRPRLGEIPGKEHLFTDIQTFRELIRRKKLLYHIQMPGYMVGTPLSELKKAPVLIHNAVLELAKKLEKTESVLKIVLTAPKSQRKSRILAREPELSEHQAEKKLQLDPRKNILRLRSQFDLVVNNCDGNFNKTVSIIKRHINKFVFKHEQS